MVTVRRHMSEVMADQICAETDRQFDTDVALWDDVAARGSEGAHLLPPDSAVWVAPLAEGSERVPVTFRTRHTRDAAIERVARSITKRRYALASAPRAEYLRYLGWRLMPDDGAPDDGRYLCRECHQLHQLGECQAPVWCILCWTHHRHGEVCPLATPNEEHNITPSYCYGCQAVEVQDGRHTHEIEPGVYAAFCSEECWEAYRNARD